ncbi:MAG: hypothetical protein AAFZ52_06720 [Bacteroidota bacterium]
MRFLPPAFLFFVTVVTVASCTADALPEPQASVCGDETLTYEADVRQIIEETCAYSGCHLGGAPGLYNDYDGLLSALNDGTFRERVVLQRADPNVGMPPNYAPNDRQQDLTEEQLTVITCWLEDGFPRE